MSKFSNRYASAVNSRNLKSSRELDKTGGGAPDDIDTLGAMAFADKALATGWRATGPGGKGVGVRPAPLAVPLQRLFAGDQSAACAVTMALAEMAFGHSFRIRVRITMMECNDLAASCLAWHRDGVCKACGGHGYGTIRGTSTIGSRQCSTCRGTKKVPLAEVFPAKHMDLARWLIDEMTREAGRAGPAAMRVLAPSLGL